METIGKKTCKICYQEIDSRAKKCPYCHHWQRPWLAISYSPVVAALPLAMMLLAFGILMHRTFGGGESFDLHRGELQIKGSEMTFGTQSNCCHGATVDVLGTLKNTGSVSWKDVNVEVQFFGQDGKLVDGGQQMQYALEVPAAGEAVFKVSMRREFPQETYKEHKIRVLSAKDSRTWP